MVLRNVVTAIIVLVLFFLSFYSQLYSSSQSNIDATVKISVCGDNIVEDPEDCEQLLPVTDSCVDIGYQSGLLSCDISCAYDLSQCVPFPDPEPPEEEENEEKPNSPGVKLDDKPIEKVYFLPKILRGFDLNGDDKINMKELDVFLKFWVNTWTISLVNNEVVGDCDLNDDDLCDLVDLSISLYHVR